MTVAQALKLALSLPNVEKGTAYGAPAVKTGGQMFACQATNKAAEPNTLAIRMDFEERDALIAEDPETYYLKDHYVPYPCVLVRLSKVDAEAMRDLLAVGRRFVTSRQRAQKRVKTKKRITR